MASLILIGEEKLKYLGQIGVYTHHILWKTSNASFRWIMYVHVWVIYRYNIAGLYLNLKSKSHACDQLKKVGSTANKLVARTYICVSVYVWVSEWVSEWAREKACVCERESLCA